MRTLICSLLVLVAGAIRAENIDLSTVPTRDAVQLTIYNSEDITLVRETRKVTFKKGANPLQFSWANTLIDPTSVELKFLTQADKLVVLDTTFPHAKPQMLYWNVNSEIDGEATIQITYFTSGITWTADYIVIADADEKNVKLDGFVRVHNNSGEEYEDAQVRLVVGTINLVEKIAQLAQMPVEEVLKLKNQELAERKKEATYGFMQRAGAMGGMGGGQTDAKEIVKEGLSEYFIFTIEGTETVPNGWSKRLRSIEAAAAPIKIQYRYRPNEYGDQLVRMYLLTNDEKSQLGTAPLPDGIVRVFRDNGREGLSYLTQQQIKYIPIGDKIELNLGPDPEVIFELIKLRAFRDELWLQINGVRELRKVGGDVVVKQENASIAGWDDHEVYSQRIRNYTNKEIEVEVRRTFPGHVIFKSQLEPTLFDYQTPQFLAKIPAGKRSDLLFEIVRKQGTSAKQNNVTLQSAEVLP
ncbi:MAG TPA: DUF4139 domain-containing protein [Pirellulaceae bacterium]|nr:DUF4139 domain-containing protein [Pirellulaceae bacterium]